MPKYNNNPAPRQIFLGNVSYDARPDDVVNALREYGIGAERVRLATYKETGAPRGFGFLDLAATEQRSVEVVIKAINDFEIELIGRVLRADRAKDRPAPPQRPQGGRGKARSEFRRDRNEFDRRGHGNDGSDW